MLKQELSISDAKVIADKVMKDIFEPDRNFKSTIFLCGKNIVDETSNRFKISDIINRSLVYSNYFEIIYPEDIFEALLFKSSSEDLLSLENLLADSVDVVVVIPESAGSFAELGAFANNEKLRNKMVCVLDKKFDKDKSFINQGPVKLLRRTNSKAVVHIDPSSLDETLALPSSLREYSRNPEVDKIISSVRNVKRSTTSIRKKLTLLGVDRFLLPSIYLLEPVGRKTLIYMTSIVTDNSAFAPSITETALGILIKKRWVQSSSEGFRLTDTGTNAYLNYRGQRGRKITNKTKAIDNLRLEILNLKYRNKKLRV